MKWTSFVIHCVSYYTCLGNKTISVLLIKPRSELHSRA